MHSQVHITQHETQQKCSESETVMAQFSMSVLWVAIKLKAIRACKHIIKMLALSLVERNEGREEEGAKASPKKASRSVSSFWGSSRALSVGFRWRLACIELRVTLRYV